MMMFETAEKALRDLLVAAAAGRFTVIGYQMQSKSAEAHRKLVQVYFSEGAFPKSANRFHGEKTHDITIEIDMTVCSKTAVDLDTLESRTATPQQKAAALVGLKTAAELANTELNELIRWVYQILMDARNDELGLDKGSIASRWIGNITKDTTIGYGGIVVKTANMKYTCRVSEDVPGDIGTEPATVTFDSEIPADDTGGAGVAVTNDNTEVA
jgi:hypothetical protein